MLLSFPLYAQLLCGVGAFGLVVTGAPLAVSRVRGRTTQPLRAALHGFGAEIGTMRLRLDRALREGRLYDSFYLPANQYERHADTLSGFGLTGLRRLADTVYVNADHLNGLDKGLLSVGDIDLLRRLREVVDRFGSWIDAELDRLPGG